MRMSTPPATPRSTAIVPLEKPLPAIPPPLIIHIRRRLNGLTTDLCRFRTSRLLYAVSNFVLFFYTYAYPIPRRARYTKALTTTSRSEFSENPSSTPIQAEQPLKGEKSSKLTTFSSHGNPNTCATSTPVSSPSPPPPMERESLRASLELYNSR